ncbi:MAG: rhomboid family intramembrane serine protease [Chitinophagaceae bacterium]|nr:rhomboid family intramembrane serine protease [Chitinophagaceae bacterium]
MRNNTLWRELRQTLLRSDRMVTQLIAVNVVIFLAINLVRLVFWLSGNGLDPVYYKEFLGVPSNLNILLRQPWTLVTSLFTQGEVMHILFNMLVLYWFGKILTEFLGNRKILPLYLLGGLCGVILFIVSYQVFPVFNASVPDARAWGASASVMAIMIAAATLVPDYSMMLVFFGPVKIKWIALFTVVLDLVSIPSSNAGGHIAHIGGALFGFVFIRQLQQGRDFSNGVNWCFDKVADLFKPTSALKVTYRTKEKNTKTKRKKLIPQPSQQEKLDSILDKIAVSGYEALSKEEKEFLFLVSKEDS